TPTPVPTKTPTPTKVPTKTPTPANRLSVSATGFTIDASGGQKTVTVTGQSGTLRADRNSNAMWLTVSVNGSSVTFKVTQNQSTSVRTGTVDITDMGSGKTVRITVTQRGSATANPTKIPTNTPAPTRVPTKAPTRKPTAIPTKTPTPTPRTGTVANYPELKVTIVSGAKEYTLRTYVNDSKSVDSSEKFYVEGIVGELHYEIKSETNPRGWLKVGIDSHKGANSANVHVYADSVDSAVCGCVFFWDDLNRYFTVEISAGGTSVFPTPTPALTVIPEWISFEARGETKSVNVKNQQGILRVDSHPDWVKTFVFGSYVLMTAEENFGAKRDGYVVITDPKTGLSGKIHVYQKENAFYTAAQNYIDIPKPRYTPIPTPTRNPANPFRITKVTGADWDGSSLVVIKNLSDGGTADIRISYEGAVGSLNSEIHIDGEGDSVMSSAKQKGWIAIANENKCTNIRIAKNPTDSPASITICLRDAAGNFIMVHIFQERSPEFYAVDDALSNKVPLIISGSGDTPDDLSILEILISSTKDAFRQWIKDHIGIGDVEEYISDYIEKWRRAIIEQQKPESLD
ncbi:MAG: BACON domain-containing protein, partial [Lachnospiraceae bacterium]|nr:BACON domain-containing protein [Lachnospiraceae bacterium]